MLGTATCSTVRSMPHSNRLPDTTARTSHLCRDEAADSSVSTAARTGADTSLFNIFSASVSIG